MEPDEPQTERSSAIICVGDDLRIFAPPNATQDPGRFWRITYKGEHVKCLRAIRMGAELESLGVLEVELLRAPGKEPSADVINAFRREGWLVRLHTVDPQREPAAVYEEFLYPFERR